MSEPFQIDVLRRKIIPKIQKGVVINMHIDIEKEENSGEGENKGEEKRELEEEKEVRKKTIIKDRRKYSTIERSLILDKLKKQKVFTVNIEKSTDKPKPTEEERIILPIGEPVGLFTKVNKVTLKKPEMEKIEEEEPEMEKPEMEKQEMEKPEEEEPEMEKPEEEEVEEPEKLLEKIVETKKRGRKPKVAVNVEDDLINIDLKTAKIRDQIVGDMLPKTTEKIIIKSPSYYMTNRLLYSHKLTQLFQPYKKEIMSSESSFSCDSKEQGTEFKLLTHQKIVRDYLNLYTPYRGLLLYHNLGSGKTCSSIALAEGMKTDKRVFIMTPASLKMNFFSELKKCGDHLYKKNQYWEFVSIDGKPEYVAILSKALSLKPEYIRTNGGAWLVNITKDPNFTQKNAEEQKEIDDQLNEMIRAKYIDINYNGINQKGFQKLIEQYGKNPFDNSVVLIDEAHNFVSRIVNKLKKPKTLSYMMYDLLMDATNARVVLITGTPIINYPNEIGILFNVLRGYIKSWTISLNVKTSDKINTETILEMFDRANFKTYDFIEYTGNKLTITRNPFGFVNTKKRGIAKGTQRKQKEMEGGNKKEGGNKHEEKGKHLKKLNITKKKHHSEYDKIVDKIIVDKEDDLEDYAEKAMRISEDPHSGGSKGREQIGGANYLESYNGVKLDESGNISDDDFINTVLRILSKNNLEVIKGNIELKKYKALPDEADSFLNMFIDSDNDEVKNIELFKKRVLGLTSYFRSAQEKLLPSFIKTSEDGDIFHIIKCEMTSHQFDVYQAIRKIEAEQEKKNKKNQKKQKGLDDEMFKISSTYRIFSRAACNFAFPPDIERPMPDKENKEISEEDLNGLTSKERQLEDEVDEEKSILEDEKVVTYQTRIVNAMKKLSYNEESPREHEFLTKDALGMYSPKFVKLLENIQSEENQGLHLVYSQFRTIEGIGIIKLILEANGYSEFKIERKSESWDIVEDIKNQGKPKFVLYTGTETSEEKEIIRNIYNSNWEFVPPSIAIKLRELHPNNFMGEVIKVFMITSSGAEGINLKNTRFVHIVEPYWNMVRPEQVIGRARRICSHQDLPDDLRTVKVFLYLSILTEEQKTSKDNIELRNRDRSKIDGETPVTTDESLFEIASLKDKINRQILKAIKESAMDCSLYASKNKDEPLVCYGSNTKVDSNNFDSYPSIESDMSQKTGLNVEKKKVNVIKITYKGKDYALNQVTNEVFDYDSYLQSKDNAFLVGNLRGVGNKKEIVFL